MSAPAVTAPAGARGPVEVLVCVKRVPAPGARIVLTGDATAVETRHLGFTVSPHEECAVEEAVRIVERFGGRVTVLTLGPAAAEEQLRAAASMGADRGILLVADAEWDPQATATAISDAVETLQAESGRFDLILFGDESADAGNHQVGIRVAHALGVPIVGGVKELDLSADVATARRETAAGVEVYDLDLPAAAAVKEGINLPRYPSLKGRLRARKAEVRTMSPRRVPGGLGLVRLAHAVEDDAPTVVLGHGAAAAPAVVEFFESQGVA
jgi:electron transfer flavoprotein beta subunit